MIRFEHVFMSYPGHGDRWVLEDLNLHVEVGEMVFLHGVSGAGKSTLLKLVTLEERPTKGEVRVQAFRSGSIRRRQIAALRRRCGVVYQDFRLIRDKTVEENISYVLRMSGVLDQEFLKAESRRALGTVGLFARRHSYPQSLSGGEQQRAAIARAIVHQPSILLADEPTGNLDREMGAEIMEILHRLNLAGATVLVATHNQDLARRYGERILVLEAGKIVSDQRIRPRPGDRFQQGL